LAVVGLAAAIVGSPIAGAIALAGFVYGVADYFGLVDKTLDALEDGWKATTNFWSDVWNKTKQGFNQMEHNISGAGRPF